jgi:sec-independent protein translocase protein TatB
VFDIGFFEFVALGVLALLIFGPDKLPKVAADAARMLRELRSMASGAKRELTEALGPEITELKDLGDLNPRTFVKKNFLDVLDDDEDGSNGSGTGEGGPASKRGRGRARGPATEGQSEAAPSSESPAPRPTGYDADTT